MNKLPIYQPYHTLKEVNNLSSRNGECLYDSFTHADEMSQYQMEVKMFNMQKLTIAITFRNPKTTFYQIFFQKMKITI